MKRNMILSVCLLLTVLTLCVAFLPNNQIVSAKQPIRETKFDKTKVLETRFLNMLNHNFVYDDDIYYEEDIVNNSVIALLNLRDKENDSYIKESILSNYIFNMYGVTDIDYSKINTDFEQKAGYVFIKPCGYTVFEHKIVSVSENEDGSYTVKTNVKISSHDSEDVVEECTTLFVKNENSEFGFNIISSVIGTPKSSI